MDIAEVLKLADELLFTNTGEHLDHLQETFLKEVYKVRNMPKLLQKII